MNAIYLIGFMGAGKTTVGRDLAKELNVSFVDVDEYIEEVEKRTINQIFEDDGEDYFRQAESKALRSLPINDIVISTGGGIVLNEKNRHFMKKNGMVIFLYCSPENLYDRLKDDDSRPLLSGDKEIEIISRLDFRLPLYKEAEYTIDTSTQSVEQIVEQITKILTKKENT